MKKNKITAAVALAIAVTVTAGGLIPAPAHANECILDERMRDRMASLNKAETELIEGQMESAETVADEVDVKKGACMPVLEQIDKLISMRLPTFGGSWAGILDKIKDAACKFADDYVKDQIESVDISYEDPYGITKVGIGGTTSGGGVVMDEYDLGGQVTDAAMEAVKSEIGSMSNSTGKIGDSISGPRNRSSGSGSVGSKVGEEVRDAFKGL